MDFKNKKLEIANKIITRAESTLYFLEEFLRNKHGGTDCAYSRSLYILLSYSFELILKSWLTLTSNAQNIENLDRELKNSLHNFEKISKKLKGNGMLEIGIRNIKQTRQKSFIEYIVETSDNTKILIQDFTNVRYDFMNDDLRDIDNDEVNRIKKEIKSLHSVAQNINDKIKNINYDTNRSGKNID